MRGAGRRPARRLTRFPHMTIAINATAALLEDKIRSRRARVGIVGLGYVGLPLAAEFAKAGFTVTGIDLSQEKVETIKRGDSYVRDVPGAVLRPLVQSGRLRATTDFSEILELDTINICVPTPLRKTKDPDMSYIVSACQEITRYFHSGTLVILESTTYPGTTDEVVLPMLQKSGLRAGEDFFLCFSPERVDPGNPKYQTSNIGWRNHAGLHRDGEAFLRTGARHRRGRQLHTGSRNGKAARKYFPHDQYRARQ